MRDDGIGLSLGQRSHRGAQFVERAHDRAQRHEEPSGQPGDGEQHGRADQDPTAPFGNLLGARMERRDLAVQAVDLGVGDLGGEPFGRPHPLAEMRHGAGAIAGIGQPPDDRQFLAHLGLRVEIVGRRNMAGIILGQGREFVAKDLQSFVELVQDHLAFVGIVLGRQVERVALQRTADRA